MVAAIVYANSAPIVDFVFKPLKHQHEVSLQFVMPNGIQYWQIEETTWSSAPILANPTGRFFYRFAPPDEF